MFRVGQKVVCVNAGVVGSTPGDMAPWEPSEEVFEGRVYTVAGSFANPDTGEPMVRLYEVRRCISAIRSWGHDGYYAIRFRPVTERKTDISFAHEILRKVSRNDRVRA